MQKIIEALERQRKSKLFQNIETLLYGIICLDLLIEIGKTILEHI